MKDDSPLSKKRNIARKVSGFKEHRRKRLRSERKQIIAVKNKMKCERRNRKIAYFSVLLYVRGNNTIEGKKTAVKMLFLFFYMLLTTG